MQQVSVRELKARLSFWLNNLPVQVTNRGEVVAVMVTPDQATNVTTLLGVGDYKQAENVVTKGEKPAKSFGTKILTEGTKEEKVKALRALIAPIESKTNASTGEIVTPAKTEERRKYTEYSEELGEDITIEGTFQDFLKQCGGKKQRATAAWKQAKPTT